MELHPYLAVWSGKECGTVAYAQRAPSMHKELILACEWKAQNVEARAPSYCLHFMPYTLCDRISASVLYCAVQHLHHRKAHGLLFRLLRVRRVSALPQLDSHFTVGRFELRGCKQVSSRLSKLIQLHASKSTPKKSLQHARPTLSTRAHKWQGAPPYTSAVGHAPHYQLRAREDAPSRYSAPSPKHLSRASLRRLPLGA